MASDRQHHSGLRPAAQGDPYAFTREFFDELSTAVRHVCISPGSRSTPLAVAAAWQEGLRCWVHVDERSAAFFALGLAKASGEPVALVCTSGTAAANYLPAIVEAHHARVPLVVLTADRPPELRDWDAGQTIDQLKLYGDAVRWFAEVPVPESGEALLRYARGLAARAVAESQGGAPGPVHLNWPLREPLAPSKEAMARARRTPGERRRVHPGRIRVSPPEDAIATLASYAGRRGVLACGPMLPDAALAEAVRSFARQAGWPLLADPASNLRAGRGADPVVAHADLLLRSKRLAAALAPEVVIRLGSTPVSKALRVWLEGRPPQELWVVDPVRAISDPSQLGTRALVADPEALFRTAAERIPTPPDGPRALVPRWLETWRAADAAAAAALDAAFDADDRLLEPRAVRELWDGLPEDAILYVSNSMPIRQLDAFARRAPAAPRVLANRGANGIDGMLSSAFGAAASGRGPTVLLTGDLAFLHDLGGLHAARHGLDLTIVLLDNDGGGIFSFLPVAALGEEVRFEELFRTPHGLDLRHAARLFGARHHAISGLDHYRSALKDALETPGVSILHLCVDRDAGVEQFRAMARAAAAAGEGAVS